MIPRETISGDLFLWRAFSLKCISNDINIVDSKDCKGYFQACYLLDRLPASYGNWKMDHNNTSEEQNKLINENLNTADLSNVSGGTTLGEENQAGFKMKNMKLSKS